MLKRPVWNMVIDVISLVVFTTMISTGLIVKSVLPPGSGRVDMVLGSHGRGHQSIDLFMGLARHAWGQIHFYISLVFLILLVIHLALHWNWILSMLWGTKSNPQPIQRKFLTLGVVAFIVLVLSFPWIGQFFGLKETLSRSELQERLDPYGYSEEY